MRNRCFLYNGGDRNGVLMLNRFLLIIVGLVACPAALSAEGVTAKPQAFDAEAIRFFESKVRPVLVERCASCHDAKKHKGELRLDSRDAILTGGESGPALVPGDPAKSLLIKAISHADEDLQMPPKKKLGDDEIGLLTQWVKMGAPFPGSATDAAPTTGAKVRPKAAKISDDDRAYWFFQPLKTAAPPVVKNKARVANAVDAFLLEKLEAKGLSFAAPAEKATLIRRAIFDLHGLPPTPAEVDAFVNDASPNAYEKLVDRLLASPRYGERQARIWLDLVRYADSDGFKSDDYRPHIWRYRDWIIDAFNADLPYDRFVTAQLAGDEANPGDASSLIATGYLRLWPYEYNQRDVHKQWNEILDDTTGNIGEVFLGLSMHCARCHNHKFDPILQEDYFKLRAFVAAIMPDDSLTLPPAAKEAEEHAKKLATWNEKTKEIRAKIEAIEGPVRASVERGSLVKFIDDLQRVLTARAEELSPFDQQIRDLAYRQLLYEHKAVAGKIKGEKKAELDKLYAELRKFDAIKPAELTPVTAVRDVSAQAPPTVIPGDKENRAIEPGYLSVLVSDGGERTVPVSVKQREAASGTAFTGRRLALAQWITRPDNAMAMRVVVNRLWQQHFSIGIVSTGNDFGTQGEPPTHPQLLDWLAGEFIAQGRSFKRMHKLIMMSEGYRQGSQGTGDSAAVDPGNTLLWKQRSYRLEAEAIRDAMLSASGELTDAMYGPGVAETASRRSVYLKFMRNNRPELIETFDGPDGFNSVSKRNVTTISPQALMLINGDWTLSRARKLADKARSDGEGITEKMIAAAYRQALGRSPTKDELKDGTAFVAGLMKREVHVAAASDAKPQAVTVTGGETVEGIAIDFRKNQQMRMADSAALKFEEFTIEAVFVLRSIDTNANVRVIASQWDGNPEHPGWSLGVTGQKSKHLPQSLILQLVGKNEDGQAAYDVVASGLKPQLNKAYHLVVTVKLSEVDSTGIAFHLRALDAGGQPSMTEPPEMSEVGHTVIKGIDNSLALVIGGRDKQPGHGWDGVLDDVRLYREGLSLQQLIGGRNPKKDALVGDWRFKADAFVKDSSGRGHDLTNQGGVEAKPLGGNTPPAKPQALDVGFEAFVDFCHVLLNSNEFLYVD